MTNIFKPAIVIAAYNRPQCLERLLHSIAHADYQGFLDVPLVISIDRSDCAEVSEIADNFVWEFGSKKIINHPENIGLKANILFCGDLTAEYEAVIVLEDDLFVSPAFYDYACQAMNFYSGLDYVSGISLYAYDFNEYAKIRFIPIHDGFDNYFLQSATSWGQLWTRKQWLSFKDWYKVHRSLPITESDLLPETVIKWSEHSWKKYFIKYMIVENKYFVVPRVSLTTNFADQGNNMKREISNYQVPLMMGKKKFNFSHINQSKSIYDSHYEITSSCLSYHNEFLQEFDFECDFYGTKNIRKIKAKYLLTIRNSTKPLASYALELIPQEINVIYNFSGNFFTLSEVGDCQSFDIKKKMFQYMRIVSDAGARKLGILFAYDLIKRIPGFRVK